MTFWILEGELKHDGYGVVESPVVTKFPGNVLTRPLVMDAHQRRVHGRHDTVNAQLKNFQF